MISSKSFLNFPIQLKYYFIGMIINSIINFNLDLFKYRDYINLIIP